MNDLFRDCEGDDAATVREAPMFKTAVLRRFIAGSARCLRASRFFGLATIVLLSLVATTAVATELDEGSSIRSLDQQVQDIKSDVLAIAAELRVLEEQLLHPADTEVAIFVSLGAEEMPGEIVLDTATVSIDGEVVAEHVYSFKEVQALQRGGVQRLHTGNLRTGEHGLEVRLRGQRAGGARFDVVERSVVRKELGPKKVGVTVDASVISTAAVRVEDW
jgi:hypothetical protein